MAKSSPLAVFDSLYDHYDHHHTSITVLFFPLSSVLTPACNDPPHSQKPFHPHLDSQVSQERCLMLLHNCSILSTQVLFQILLKVSTNPPFHLSSTCIRWYTLNDYPNTATAPPCTVLLIRLLGGGTRSHDVGSVRASAMLIRPAFTMR